MVRVVVAIVAIVAAAALVAVSPAAAKAPPDGVRVCGVAACVTVAQPDAEPLAVALFWQGGNDAGRAPVGPYYELRWNWPGRPEQIGYWIPGAGVARIDLGNGLRRWAGVKAQTIATLRRATAGLAPFVPAPPAVVTVGGRLARGAATYVRLFTAGEQTWTWVDGGGGWLAVTLHGASNDPWLGSEIRVARSRPLLWIDADVFRIPRKLAVRIRAGLPLA